MAQPLLIDPPNSRRRIFASIGVLAAASALFGGGGCLYTDPVNKPPTVQINAPSQVWRDEVFTFTANVSDPNGDSVKNLDWAHTICPGGSGVGGTTCDPCQLPAGDPSRVPNIRVTQPSYQPYDVGPPDSDGPFCVWALATDPHGASTSATPYPVFPRNHPPVAEITMLKPILTPDATKVPMYAEIELSAADSVDAENDDLTFVWNLLRVAPGSLLPVKAYPGTCSPPQADSSFCLMPDAPGSYTVELTARDRYAGADDAPVPPSTVTREIVVAEDQLPCLDPRYISPMAAVQAGFDPSAPATFNIVMVSDDGDPYPAVPGSSGKLRFDWYRGLAPGPLEYVGNDVPSYTVNPEYSSGDEVIVRVEIFDRNVNEIKAILQECGAADTCGEVRGQSVCNQRMTWHLRYQ